MTKEDIKLYDLCKEHKRVIHKFIKDLPHDSDMYGSLALPSNVEYKLQAIHSRMNHEVADAYNKALGELNTIIKEI
jgi:hypothetical protein